MSKDLAMQENEKEAQNIQWDIHETEEAKPLDFTEENKAELFGLEPIKANEMVSGLQTTLAERKVLKDAYVEVIGLEITTENLSTFKQLRLKIVKNRTQGLTKWKEKEKAFYLAGGNFIQAIYNKEIAVNEEMESKLLEAEKFFENQEKEKADLKAKQDAELKAEQEAKKEAEKLAKAPIKKQLSVWVDEFSIAIPSNELLNNDVALDIKSKFEAFKKWAKSEIEKL